jgi:hypothetical protein
MTPPPPPPPPARTPRPTHTTNSHPLLSPSPTGHPIPAAACVQGSLTIRDELKAQQDLYIEKLLERQAGKVKVEPAEGDRRAVDEKQLLDVRAASGWGGGFCPHPGRRPQCLPP